MSPAGVWVSHVAYRVPPWSRLRSPSIHQVGSAMEPAVAPTSVRCFGPGRAVGRGGEELMPGVEGIGRGRAYEVAPGEQVHLAVRLDEHRRAVPAAAREARAHRDDRAPGLATVGGLLDDRVHVAGLECAAAVRGADKGDQRRRGTVIPGHIDGAGPAHGDEVPVAPVALLGRQQRGDLREARAVVGRGVHHGVLVAAGLVHEGDVHGAVRRHGEGRVPAGAPGSRCRHRLAEVQAAVGRPGEADPGAADPQVVDVVRGTGGGLHLGVLARAALAHLGDRADAGRGAGVRGPGCHHVRAHPGHSPGGGACDRQDGAGAATVPMTGHDLRCARIAMAGAPHQQIGGNVTKLPVTLRRGT